MEDFGVETFGLALGFGDEMSRGEMDNEKLRLEREAEDRLEAEMEELVNLQAELETNKSFSLRSRQTKDKPLDEFAKYLDDVLNNRVDVEWAVFNRQGTQ